MARKKAVSLEPVALPIRMTIEDDGQTLRLTRRWLDRSIYASIALVAVTTVVLLRALIPSLFNAEAAEPTEPVILLLVAALAVFFVYTTISSLVNHSLIVVDAESISVKHRPLPFRDRRFERSEITRVYVTSLTDNSPDRWGPVVSYDVRVRLGRGKGKKDHKLVSQIYNEAQARFIEQEIKRFWQL